MRAYRHRLQRLLSATRAVSHTGCNAGPLWERLDMPVPRARMTIPLLQLLLASATAARAECALTAHAYSNVAACNRDFPPPSDSRPLDAAAQALRGLHWMDSNDWIHNPPQWLREAEESRRLRAPLPVVHLWRSQQTQTLFALGVSRRGLPGLYSSH